MREDKGSELAIQRMDLQGAHCHRTRSNMASTLARGQQRTTLKPIRFVFQDYVEDIGLWECVAKLIERRGKEVPLIEQSFSVDLLPVLLPMLDSSFYSCIRLSFTSFFSFSLSLVLLL